MSSGPDRPHRFTALYARTVIVLGAAVVALSLNELAAHPISGLWIVLTLLTAVTGFATLRIPNMPISFSISDTFAIIAALIAGPAAGAVTAAVDGLVLSCRMSNNRRSPDRILFNMAFPAIATWIAGQIFFFLAGPTPAHAGALGALRLLGMLAVFGGVDFVLTTGAVALAVSLEKGARVIDVWREHFVGLWMSYFGGIFAAMLMMVMGQVGTLEMLILIAPLPIILYVAFRHVEARAHDQIDHLGKMNKVYLAAIEALAQAIDTKDQVTHDHIRRVQTESVRLARAVGVHDERVLEAVKAAALLHDVGKIGIPEHILNKPGRLNVSEFEIMKTHAAMGADILSVIDFPYPVVPIVRHHHENWDGTGYPDALKGDAIPVGARILQIVDCFDALTSDRPYRRRMENRDALQILADRKGTMYDPNLVDAFFALHGVPVPGASTAMQHRDVGKPTTAASENSTDGNGLNPLAAFYDLGCEITPAVTVEGLGRLAWRHLAPLMPNGAFVLYKYDTASHALTIGFISNPALLDADVRIPVGERLTGWVAATGQTIVNSDPALDELHAPGGVVMRSTLAVPCAHEGTTLGVLSFYGVQADSFTHDHVRAAEALAGVIRDTGVYRLVKSGFVAFLGRPNAGKSTLLNRIVGHKLAIVSDKPQTTRNRIVGVKNYDAGQVVFVDTPGVHRPTHRMNVRMVDVALEAMREVDLLTLVVDVSVKAGPGDRHMLELLKDVKTPVILALNKVDQISKPKLLPIIERYSTQHAFVEFVPISALDGTNVEALEQLFLKYLPDGEPLYPPDYVTDQPERFFVAEIIREQVLQSTHAELPFSTAVVIDRYDTDAEPGLVNIYATILVERESQKPIVIGKGGTMIKKIGTAARAELLRYLESKVYLDLHVKVRSEWRDDERVLDEMGLNRE